jgi:hypothetical protein
MTLDMEVSPSCPFPGCQQMRKSSLCGHKSAEIDEGSLIWTCKSKWRGSAHLHRNAKEAYWLESLRTSSFGRKNAVRARKPSFGSPAHVVCEVRVKQLTLTIILSSFLLD